MINPLLRKTPLVVIDAQRGWYSRYVGRKLHVRVCTKNGELLDADAVEQFRLSPQSMLDDPLDAA